MIWGHIEPVAMNMIDAVELPYVTFTEFKLQQSSFLKCVIEKCAKMQTPFFNKRNIRNKTSETQLTLRDFTSNPTLHNHKSQPRIVLAKGLEQVPEHMSQRCKSHFIPFPF